MHRWLRRLLILLVIGGSGVAFRVARQKRAAAAAASLGPSTEWPPLQVVPAPSVPHPHEVDRFTAVAEVEADVGWVAPVDGACPDGYPIKANASSRIFHMPGGRFYDRTVPERCYASSEAAERDGYRQAKA